MKTQVVLTAALAVLACSRALAQVTVAQVQGLAPGTRVRVSAIAAEDREMERRTTSTRWTVGTVHEVASDALVIRTRAANPDATVSIPLDLIQAVEVSRGKRDVPGSAGRGALRGTLIGALVGGVFTGMKQVMDNDNCGSEGGCRNRIWTGILATDGESVVRDVAGGAILGATVGALAGSRSREVWEPAAQHVTVGAAREGGTRVGLAFRF
ncbi:MAG TPA: hypothetical protein VF092_21975 [Longimicrobium sp.]